MPEAKRKLKNIKPEEISLVDFPANMTPFFFIKQDGEFEKAEALNLTIKSDGTAAGTEIQVNGKTIKDIVDFTFSYWVPTTPAAEAADQMGDPISPHLMASWAIKGEGKQFKYIYGISKAEIDKAREALEKTDEADAEEIKKALELLETYMEDFPSDLADAMQTLMKRAGETEEEPEGDEEGIKWDIFPPGWTEKYLDKAGAKVSRARTKMLKDLETSLSAASEIIRNLMESLEPVVQKDEGGETEGDAKDAPEGTEGSVEGESAESDDKDKTEDKTTAVAEQEAQTADAKTEAETEGAEEASGTAGEDKPQAAASLFTPELATSIASTVGSAVSASVGRLLGTNDKEGNSE